MKYRTKGGTSPQGKTKIYFACHLSDLKLLDRICLDIWKHRDVVVCYKDADEAINEEDLSLMQLMVIPVTSKLLEDAECSVYDEFAFFCQNNLPVLPLMLERGLESLYAQKFNNVQFLSMMSGDATALSFEDRMRYTLDVLLPDEEVIERVRNAFAAYIFLSYRKKDRQKAQELMQMIHRIPEYRDVAIWYDEFIVGSEDFNDSISRALAKCDLFALMITPNLIAEENYVKEIEYPMALQENKEILPIEMVDTNREEFGRQFEKITNIIKGTDEAFQEYLQEKYKKLAFARREGHPEHDYLIGLAYLNGIDVETNYVLAEQMIREAADAGVVEAMGELVNMLYYGKGVACNRSEAIQVQKRKIAAVSQRDNRATLAEELGRLGNMYIDMRRLEEAKKTYEELRAIADAALRAADTEADINKLTVILGDSWLKTGNIRDMMCKRKDALAAYQQAMDTVLLSEGSLKDCPEHDSAYIHAILTLQTSIISDEEFPEDKFNAAAQTFLAGYKGDKEKAALILHTSNVKYGNMLMRVRDAEAALRKYRNAEAIARLLMELKDNEESRRRLCQSMVEAALCCVKTGNCENIEEKVRYGLEIAEKLCKEVGNAEDIHICKRYYDCLGTYYKKTAEWEQAYSYYTESYELCRKYLEKENSIEAKLDMVDACINMGTLMYERESYPEANEYCKKALGISSLLEGRINEPEYQYSAIRLLFCYGDVKSVSGNKRDAWRSYEMALEKVEALFFRSKDLELLYIAAPYYIKKARLEYGTGDLKRARVPYWKGLFLAALFEKDGDGAAAALYKQYKAETGALENALAEQNAQEYNSDCMEILSRYAADGNGKRTSYGSKYLLNKEVLSENSIGYAADLSRLIYLCEEGLFRKAQESRIVSAHVNGYTRLAELEAFLGLEKAAEADYDRAIATAEKSISVEVLPTLILACEKMIQFKIRYNDRDDTPRYYDIIERAAERIAAESHSQEAYLALANWYNKKGHTEDDSHKKLEYHQKAFRIAERIWKQVRGNQQSPLLKDWYDLLDTFERENEVIELRFGQDNRRANGLLIQWMSSIDCHERARLYGDLDRYLLQDNTGNALRGICDCLRVLYEQGGVAEEAEKMAEMKAYIDGELEKENAYFQPWMKLVQAKHLWEVHENKEVNGEE